MTESDKFYKNITVKKGKFLFHSDLSPICGGQNYPENIEFSNKNGIMKKLKSINRIG